MLGNAPVHPTIPVTDLERARGFYTKQLGLPIEQETEGHLIYTCGGGTHLTVFQRATPTSGEHTACSFEVDDIESVVEELEKAGATFETFPEMPDVEIDGVVHWFEGFGSVWMRDPDGNLIAVSQRPEE